MKKITLGVLALLMFAACSNPIDASEDDDERTSDTSLRTDPGDGVSTRTDSLYKDDKSTVFPQVNTVTGEIYKPGGSSESDGAEGAPGASGKPAQSKPGTK